MSVVTVLEAAEAHVTCVNKRNAFFDRNFTGLVLSGWQASVHDTSIRQGYLVRIHMVHWRCVKRVGSVQVDGVCCELSVVRVQVLSF